jgi:hypothetical protein
MFLTLTNRKHKGLVTQWLLVDDQLKQHDAETVSVL